jgi:hypothetical protein
MRRSRSSKSSPLATYSLDEKHGTGSAQGAAEAIAAEFRDEEYTDVTILR